MASIRRLFFADLGTKLLSLILALAVYIHVFSGQDREMSYRVPLEIAPLPAGIAIANEVPSEVRVRVHASGKDLLKLKTRRLRAEIAIESPRPGLLQRPVLGSDMRIPRGARISSIEVLEPRTLNLQIERIGTKVVPVAVRLRDEAADRALLARPIADPAEVTLHGPPSKISAIDSVHTEPVPVVKTTDREIAVIPPEGTRAEPARVVVHVETDSRRTKRFSVPIEVRPAQRDRLLWIQPTEVEVVVHGAASVVDGIRRPDLHVIGDIGQGMVGSQRVGLRPILIGPLSKAPLALRCSPDSASVRLQ